MILAQTPFRLSICGGGNDFPDYYTEHGPVTVVGGAIDKYSYIFARELPRFFPHKSRICYNKIELVSKNSDIEHKAVRAVIQYLGLDEAPLEINHVADLPSFSGVGSSSSFIVGLLNALARLQKVQLKPAQLRETAIHIERNVLKESVGCQDQTFAAHGDLDILTFSRSGVKVTPFAINSAGLKALEANLLLLFTGYQRVASQITASYKQTLADRLRLNKLAENCVHFISNGQYKKLGTAVWESWNLKRSLSPKVSNKNIDEMLKIIMDCGAYGAKLIGAGGGGMIMVVAPPNRKKVIIAETQLLPITFSFAKLGSTIILDGESRCCSY